MSMFNFSRWLRNRRSSLKCNKKSWKWQHVSLILALGGAPRADLHRKPPNTMGHESLIQRRPSLSHPGSLKYFFQTYNPLLYITIHLDISNQEVSSIAPVLFLCLLLKMDFLLCFWIPEAAHPCCGFVQTLQSKINYFLHHFMQYFLHNLLFVFAFVHINENHTPHAHAFRLDFIEDQQTILSKNIIQLLTSE